MSENSPAGPAPAGWYPDPSGDPSSRWWDGAEWTSHTAPPIANPSATAPGSAHEELGSGTARSSELPRPRAVQGALGLYLLKLLTMVVGFIATVTSLGTASTVARKAEAHALAQQHVHGISTAQLQGYLTVTLIVAVVISGLYVVAFAMFAAFAGRGANWARVVLLVLTCVGVLGTGLNATHLFHDPASILGLLGTVAGIIATILLFVPGSRQYFAAIKARKWTGHPATSLDRVSRDGAGT